MKELSFPLWCIKYGEAVKQCGIDCSIVEEIIDIYTGVANNQNIVGAVRTETDLAMSIGRLYLANEGLCEPLKKLFTRDNCVEGMRSYLAIYQNGTLLQIADEIDDHGGYLNILKGKFDASESTWVWSMDTVNQRINDVILEYQIIRESNHYMTKCSTLRETMQGWREKTSYIRIAYEAGKGHFGEAEKLLSLLLDIRKTGGINRNVTQALL